MKQEKNIKRNVPNLRFPEFTGEWEEYKLKNIAIVANCKVSGSDIINFISTENILQNFGGTTFNNTSKPSSATSFKVGDVLLSNIRPYLKKVYFADVDGGCSNDVLVFRSNDKCESLYLYYTIANNNFIDFAMQGAKGVKMPRGDREQMLSYRVHLPSKQEQQKIATLLSLLDDRISTQMKIIEDLKVLKSAIGERLFIDSQCDYKVVTLGDITKNFSVRNKNNDPISVYSVTNDAGFMRQSEKFENREIAGEDTSTYKIIHQGEFAYNPARINVGSIARYNELSPCIISSLYVCFKPAKDILSDWLLHLLKSKRIMYYYNVFGEGGVRLYLFYPNFSRIKIKLPSYKEQVKVANLINSIDSKLLLETSLLNSYMQQKQYLLSQMFI